MFVDQCVLGLESEKTQIQTRSATPLLHVTAVCCEKTCFVLPLCPETWCRNMLAIGGEVVCVKCGAVFWEGGATLEGTDLSVSSWAPPHFFF